MLTQNKRLVGIFATVALILMIPLVAMQFNNGVNWSGFDFLVMAFLLSGTGLICEFALRKIKSFPYRVVVIGAVLFALFLLWAELAVGIFGTPFAGS